MQLLCVYILLAMSMNFDMKFENSVHLYVHARVYTSRHVQHMHGNNACSSANICSSAKCLHELNREGRVGT